MIEDHAHDENGHVIISAPSPAETQLETAEAVTEASVQIAKIEADKEITLAKIQAKMIDPEMEAELAAARAELETLRALVAPPEPEPTEQAAPVVIVDDSSSGSETEPSLPEPDEQDHQDHAPKHSKPAGLGMW
jgi:hypothetical protein